MMVYPWEQTEEALHALRDREGSPFEGVGIEFTDSPEIIESEVSKKIEEGVNSIAGISALTSRSYESQSVVVIECSSRFTIWMCSAISDESVWMK